MENQSKNLFLKFFTLKSTLAFCIFIALQSFHISADATAQVSNPNNDSSYPDRIIPTVTQPHPGMKDAFYLDRDSDYKSEAQQAAERETWAKEPSQNSDRRTSGAEETEEEETEASIPTVIRDSNKNCYSISSKKMKAGLQKCLDNVKKNHFTKIEGRQVLTKCYDQQVAAYSCCNNPSKCSAEYKDGKHNAFGLNRDSLNMLLDAYPVIATAPFAFGKSFSNNEQCKLANQLNTLGTTQQNLNALAEITEKSCLEKSYACIDDCNQAIEDMHKAVAECLLPDTPEEDNSTKSITCLGSPYGIVGSKQCYICKTGHPNCNLCLEGSNCADKDGRVKDKDRDKVSEEEVKLIDCKSALVVKEDPKNKKICVPVKEGDAQQSNEPNEVTLAIQDYFRKNIKGLFKAPVEEENLGANLEMQICEALESKITESKKRIYYLHEDDSMAYTRMKELDFFRKDYYNHLFYENEPSENEDVREDVITLENMAGMDCKKYEDRSTRATPQQQLRQFQMTMCPKQFSPLGNRPDIPNAAAAIAAGAAAGSLASGAEINKEISTPDLNSLSIPPDNSVASAEHPGGSYNPGFSDGGSSMAGGDSGLGGFGSPLGGGSSPGYGGYPGDGYSPSLSDGGYYSAAAGSNLGVFDDNSGYTGSSANNDRSPSSTTNTPSIGKYLPDGASSGTTIFRKASFIIQKYCEDKVIDGCYQK